MKNASKLILLLTVLGFLVLIASAFYFGAPLFGWIIIFSIFSIFLASSIRDFKLMQKIEAEREILKAQSNHLDLKLTDCGVVGERITAVQKLSSRGVPFSSQLVTEILDAKAAYQVGRSMGGVVVLLGLLGTFFGLMLAVSTAGSAMDNSTTQNTLNTIQSIFSSMKGIFGTSLAGLFAALILNATHALVEKENADFISDLDKFTVFDLIPTFSHEEKSSDTQVHELMGTIAANMQKNQEATLSSISETFIFLQKEATNSLTEIAKNQSKSLEAFLTQAQQNWTSMEHFATKEIQSSIESLSSTFAENTSKQMDSFKEQSNQFMQTIATSAESTQVRQMEGLDALRSIAAQITDKAQTDSSAFSATVATEFGAFAEKIQTAFGTLTSSSSTLVESQQRLITDVESRTMKELEAAEVLAENISEAATLMRVNQSEFAANLEILRHGLETIIEKLSGDTAEHEEENNFMEQLQASLQAFHERASEVLMENAVKTQEILLEVLEQAQRMSASSSNRTEG